MQTIPQVIRDALNIKGAYATPYGIAINHANDRTELLVSFPHMDKEPFYAGLIRKGDITAKSEVVAPYTDLEPIKEDTTPEPEAEKEDEPSEPNKPEPAKRGRKPSVKS